MEYINLTYEQKDVLREIGNIGAGNAATSLSKLLNTKVEMNVPSVNIVSYDEIMELIGGPDETIVGLMFRILGEAPGTVYLILSVDEAEYLVRILTNDPGYSLFDGERENELAMSALHEIGNIVTGSYLTALSDFTKINMQPSVPYLGIDMAGAILTVGLLEISQVTDYAIIIDTEINNDDSPEGIHGNFFLLPDPESFSKLFNALGINDDE
ncbi:chemotaxis protein CheC [Oceanobacillus massiliensis]|uniref:chemotaxis protein CheC n=1 Tax=Oceanobacillus massiliensis TaxID=1465765 RepID=UPI00028A3E72|nr:chemotaxis protein CheC [Oceanobacillus massiliensis]